MAEVVTGEAVILDIPCARFPSRIVALLIDYTIQFVLLFAMLIVVSMIGAGGALDAASGAAVVITTIVLVVIGYPVAWESATRGRSPGKLALGLRVVSDDGSPERFRQALVRGLVAVVEIWWFLGVPALICSLISGRGKRLGDVFAGTFVIQQRLPARRSTAAVSVAPPLTAWAAGLELSALTDRDAQMASRYLARLPELRPEARAQLGAQIAAVVSSQVSPPPPPGTPVDAYLSAVLAERRRRQRARSTPPGAAAPPGTPSPAPDAAWPAAAGTAPHATPGVHRPAPQAGLWPVDHAWAGPPGEWPPDVESSQEEPPGTAAQPADRTATAPAQRRQGFVPPA